MQPEGLKAPGLAVAEQQQYFQTHKFFTTLSRVMDYKPSTLYIEASVTVVLIAVTFGASHMDAPSDAIFLCYFLQSPCCSLHGEGCNRNLSLYVFPGFLQIHFVFNIKQGIIDPWEGLPNIFVVAAWSKDNMSVGKEKENLRHTKMKAVVKNMTPLCQGIYKAAYHGKQMKIQWRARIY